MEDLIQNIINNGLGVASFIALMYFINNTLKDLSSNLSLIKDTLVTIQTSLVGLNERVSDVEERIKGENNVNC